MSRMSMLLTASYGAPLYVSIKSQTDYAGSTFLPATGTDADGQDTELLAAAVSEAGASVQQPATALWEWWWKLLEIK